LPALVTGVVVVLIAPMSWLMRNDADDTMKLLALRAHKKRLELACRIAPEIPEALLGDPGRIRQNSTSSRRRRKNEIQARFISTPPRVQVPLLPPFPHSGNAPASGL